MNPHTTPDFFSLPLIAMPRTNMQAPAEPSPLQQILLPWADGITVFWWALLLATAAYLVWYYLARPAFNPAAFPPEKKAAQPQPKTWSDYLDRFFSIHEVRDDMVLRWFGGAILLGYIATFSSWWGAPATTVQAPAAGLLRCWPFFQSCGEMLWLQMPPFGYSQPIFYAAMLGLIVLAGWGLVTHRVRFAHVCFGLLFLAKVYLMLQNYNSKGNFDYYHTTFALIYLMLPHKRFFGSVSLPLFYFLSTVAKLHPSWVLAGYFTPMTLGLPFFGNELAPLATNALIFMEMVAAWFLFSKRPRLQQCMFWFFVLFHLYSSILVAYRYPVTVLPVLMVFFGPYFKPFVRVPLGRSSIPGWSLVGTLVFLQFVAPAIPGDEKLTLEGNFYGLYMFEANHQCGVRYTDATGATLQRINDSNPRNRCDPWDFLQIAQQRFCSTPGVAQPVRMEIIHSINGGPFYKIVDEADACNLTFNAFGKNSWIKDADTAPVVGRPFMNYYR